jgi:hypothetical protein
VIILIAPLVVLFFGLFREPSTINFKIL